MAGLVPGQKRDVHAPLEQAAWACTEYKAVLDDPMLSRQRCLTQLWGSVCIPLRLQPQGASIHHHVWWIWSGTLLCQKGINSPTDHLAFLGGVICWVSVDWVECTHVPGPDPAPLCRRGFLSCERASQYRRNPHPIPAFAQVGPKLSFFWGILRKCLKPQRRVTSQI